MDWTTLYIIAPLVVLLILAATTDVRHRRIPNWLTLTLVISGIGVSLTSFGLVGPREALLGLAVAFFVPFVLFALGAMGAGDVKLLAGIGAWVGVGAVVWVLLIAGIAGGVLVIAMTIHQRRILPVLRNTAVIGLNLLHIRRLGVENVRSFGTKGTSLKQTVPYGVPIVLAALVVLFGRGLWS